MCNEEGKKRGKKWTRYDKERKDGRKNRRKGKVIERWREQ